MREAIEWQQVFMRLLITLILGLTITVSLAQAAQDPPLDEFAYAAPKECWTYTRWNAPFSYDENSENATERLMTEPEVQAFVNDIRTRIGLIAPAFDDGEDSARTELLHKVGPQLVDIIFKRDGCFFVESINVRENGEPTDIKAALILDAGRNAATLARDIASVINIPATTMPNNDLTYETTPDSNFPIVITTAKNLLFIASSRNVIDAAKARMAASSAPKWLQEFKCSRGVKHVSNLSYINVRKIRSTLVGRVDVEQNKLLIATGLNNAETIESCTGLTDKEAFSRTLLTSDGRPEGVLDLASPKGLTDEDLAKLPADSMFASGLSFDMRRGLRWLNLAVNMMSGGRENLSRGIQELESKTGVRLAHDLVANLGNSWTLYNGAGDGWLSGMTLTTTVRDAEALNSTVKTLVKTVMKQNRHNRNPTVFSEKTVGDNTITSMMVPGFPMLVEPSWSISSERLIVGLFPQAVESALKFPEDQNATDSRLLDESDLKFLRTSFVNGDAKSTLLGMTYVDTATNLEMSFPSMHVMTRTARSMTSNLTRRMPEKIASQVAALVSGIQLPRTRVVHRHLEPSLLAIRQTELGMELETRQTIPSLDLGSTVPIGVATLLPAVSATRTAARRVVSQNKMRQHVLAALNHESAYMRFPAAYSVGEEGQKLLSWRVHILPFIEQNELYKQFKLDEPWDSPHNITLIDKMPEDFRSPVSKVARGMTTYRGVGGKTGVLQPAQRGKSARIGLRHITDGSTNTIFLVETSDELAVEWTKPNGGLDPDSFDFAKVSAAFDDGINIAMCDGSVRSVDKSVDAAQFKGMMTRAGGEVIRQPTTYNRQRRSRRRTQNTPASPVDPRFKVGQSRMLKLEDIMSEADRIELAQDDFKNKAREVGLAILNFESTHQGFPSAFTTDDAGKPLLSWRIHILPFLGQNDLYKQFRLNEPWDSDHNKQLISKMPDAFSLTSGLENGMTCLRANGGPDGTIRKPTRNGSRSNRGIGFRNIPDGSSNTIMLINAGSDFAIQWTKPESFEPSDADLKTILASEPIIGIADSSVIQLKSSMPMEKMKEMLTASGGEVVKNREDYLKK